MAGVKGRSGRKPKPTAQLKLHGGFRSDRRYGDEPTPDVHIPDPPKVLKGAALAEWDRITQLLAEVKCISRLDRGPLTAYCLEWARYIKANQRLSLVRSLLAEGSTGNKVPHPLLRVADKAFANMLKICTEFGLTPAARTRLSMAAAGEAVDPFDELIRQQAERRKKAATAKGTG